MLICGIAKCDESIFCTKQDFAFSLNSEFKEANPFSDKFQTTAYALYPQIKPLRPGSYHFFGTASNSNAKLAMAVSIHNFTVNENTRIETAFILQSKIGAKLSISINDMDKIQPSESWTFTTDDRSVNGRWTLLDRTINSTIRNAQVYHSLGYKGLRSDSIILKCFLSTNFQILLFAYTSPKSVIAIDHFNILNGAIDSPDCKLD